jgi:AmmeMemoRadiSam system protein A
MNRFAPAQRALLLSVARAALVNHLAQRLPPSEAAAQAVNSALAACAGHLDDELLVEAACFVTLWDGVHGQLRGCRGEFAAQQPLLDAVANMALAAALDDPRFPPLTLSEVPHLRIEINVLSPLTPILPEEVEVGKHGLLIVLGDQRGLLLPQVAVDHHMQRDTFLDALCWKAGLPENFWRHPEARLWSFETEAWEEQ